MTGSSKRRRERGSAALEVAGLVPIILLAALAALQVGVVAWTVVSTGQAVKDAARAASLGQDAQSAAGGALPGSLAVQSLTGGHSGDSVRYTLTVRVPTLGPFSLGSVTRSAEMPDIK